MKKRNIYQNRSQEIFQILGQANSSKIMCVPIDYAKKDHVVMFCNACGDIIRKPFSVKNSPQGVGYLIDQTLRSCRKRHIKKQHVLFGGEDVNSYAENFAGALQNKGWLVANVNAHDAKKQRDNLQASTDRLDLMGIAAMLLSCRANCRPAQSGAYRNLRTLVRHRKKLVKMNTEVRNRVHTVVDRLFPGFLDERKSGIYPFSDSCLYLMENRFSMHQIQRRRRSSLIEKLRQNGAKDPEKTAAKLHAYTAEALAPQEQYIPTLQASLGVHVKHLRCLKDSSEQLEREMALAMAQTPGAFLTSIKGIGIVLAAGMTAEIGDPFCQKPVSNLTSYAGIVPRVKQSGGPAGQPRTSRVGKRCNHNLKDHVVQAAFHIGRHGPEELMTDYSRRQANGQHADFGMARRYIRMGLCLMRTSQIYLPSHLRKPDIDPRKRAEYYLSLWPAWRAKWERLNAAAIAFSKNHPLGEWRCIVEQLYGIKLKL
jgi:transposase